MNRDYAFDLMKASNILAITAVALIALLLPGECLGEAVGQQGYLKGSDPFFPHSFGASLGISGDTIVVGSYDESSEGQDSGAAYVFLRNGSTWTPQAFLKPLTLHEFDNFGESVAISGDTIVIGAPGDASSSSGVNGDPNDTSAPRAGAAYIFVRVGTNWVQQAYLKASNCEADDMFGFTVAISSNTVVIGALQEDSSATGVNGLQGDNSAGDSGAAYVFVRNGTNWSQQAYLKASNTGANDAFGCSVAISGETIVVGAFREDSSSTGVNGNQLNDNASDAGAAYVFVRNGFTWSQQAYLKASNTDARDIFGGSVALSGNTTVVGAQGESSSSRSVNGNQSDNSSGGSGAAYVFVRTGTNWAQQSYLKASNADSGDCFGGSVAISGDTIVIGAPCEGSSGRGIDTGQADNTAPFAGAAYAFVRGGGVWIQQAYLKASNAERQDFFGGAVAVYDDTTVIGASEEDSAATGVNGDQTDNSNSGAGAAYVFGGLGRGVLRDGTGGYILFFKGIPGLSYRIERAPTVTGPWSAMATNVANEIGTISVHDTNALPVQAFYRTVR